MFPITKEEIDKLQENQLDKLAELDSKGLLIAPGETVDHYKQRLTCMANNYNEFNQELKKDKAIKLFDYITVEDDSRIPKDIMHEAAELDHSFYKFTIDWVPGFFLTENLGYLWGGCALSSPETMMSIFLIRKSFRNKKKWYLYYRSELLAHEISHVARTPIGDMKFEEYFAYQLSPSWLRRTFGSCFQSGFDALFFITPVFLLLFATTINTFFSLDFAMWPFWILITISPIFLITRNFFMRRMILAAKKNLAALGYDDLRPILYRCHKQEIAFFAKNSAEKIKAFIDKKVFHELRWKIIKYRFIDNKQ